ncbi:MAG TPA: type II secretion system F family protein [Tepidisphaeraceae bacterium]|nr:type II secretion system F family protein [Tepidisphaeraceae bacterium]
MGSDPQRLLAYLSAAAAFGLVLSLWLLLVLLWSSRRRARDTQLRQRLTFEDSTGIGPNGGRVLRLWHDGREATTIVPGLRGNRGIGGWLMKLRADAGLETPISQAMLTLTVVLFMVGAVTFLITSSVLVSVMGVAGALVVFWIYLSQRIARRSAKFERQLMDALQLSARSLRVGHPLVGSFRLIAEEIPAPVGELFGSICQQQALGVPMGDALREVAEKTLSEDLKLFATCVIIQLRSGGNLADMMDRLAQVIRERQRLARRVKVLTTQTQFSKRVLLALPFLMYVILNVMNPDYMHPLYSTTGGRLMLFVAAIGLLLGWLTMNWLSKLNP